jgi:hypothetical protein
MLNTRQDLEWLSKREENKGRKNFKKHERKNQIEQVVLDHLYMHRKAMSMRQIAKALHMSPQRSVTHLLEDMVLEGRLICKRIPYKGGACNERFEYTIPPARLAAGVAGAVGVGGGES